MKRLYEVVKLHDNGLYDPIRIGEIGPVYTDNKMKAKLARDNCNINACVFDDEGVQQKPFRFIVTRGPDHHKGRVRL